MTRAELDALRHATTEHRETSRHAAKFGASLAPELAQILRAGQELVEPLYANLFTLLDEVGRLRANIERAHADRDCACGHPPGFHGLMVRCVTCDAEIGVH